MGAALDGRQEVINKPTLDYIGSTPDGFEGFASFWGANTDEIRRATMSKKKS
jgi:hypothetical protein